MIIVGGCSWACGEWSRGDLPASRQLGVVHRGLSQYIEDSGKIQINVGRQGASNLLAAHSIEQWLARNPDSDVEKIFVFQTDYVRDYGMRFDEDYEKIEHPRSLAHIMLARYYAKLIEISEQYSVPVFLIGGVGDTLAPELIHNHYKPLTVACQSMTNLMLHDRDKIEDPVLSWYLGSSYELVQEMKRRLSTEHLPDFLKDIDRGMQRQLEVFECSSLFWPDGCHPNRHAFKKLYDFLRGQKYL